jgi:hypothetical protein
MFALHPKLRKKLYTTIWVLEEELQKHPKKSQRKYLPVSSMRLAA